MSRTKVRAASEVCADCTAPDPTWASINRGVLICDECCSVHRSLGRHISQVKSLTKGQWSPTQLLMVQHLANHGANSIWEHSLLDPSQSKHGKKKPGPRDQVHPVKTEFIRSKYQFLQFVNKQRDGELSSIDDLSKQLHSSVRTNNLETCLRLLSKGADPNYFHPEKGNCPLHVAGQSGQPLQVELLVVYGADPGAYDSNGKTPIDHAKTEGQMDLADRLVECQYELTDRLAYYLCQRKPDHRTGIHFKIPEMADSSLDMSELAKQAKKKLQALPNHLFEELAMDVYDEVDRRENDEHWLQTHDNKALVSDRQGVPFLPLNPDFSATRNQGRQKLARFNAREFATLIIDILNDAKRRQTGVMSPVQIPKEPDKLPGQVVQRKTNFNSIASDEEPIYDQVASDEDYSSIDNLSIKSAGMKDSSLSHPPAIPRKYTNRQTSVGNLRSSGDLVQDRVMSFMPRPPSVPEAMVEGPVSTEEFLQMKKKLSTMEFRMQQILKNNQDLQRERDDLTQLVQTLTKEISILRNQTQHQQSPPTTLANGYSPDRGEEDGARTSTPRSGTRPQSMFEPREREQRLSNKTPSKDSLPTAYSVSNIHKTDETDSNRVQSSSSGSGVEEIQCAYPPDLSHYDCPSSLPVNLDEELPSQEEVMRKTEKITKNIQELYKSGQDGKHDSFGHCADKIYDAVKEMAALFPKNPRISTVRHALNLLTSSAARLQEECQDGIMGDLDPDLDLPFKTQQVMQCAFDIARAAKELVTLFQ
ncbi:ARF GTPase-activating protein GIT2-like isoform X2 [Ostrea edulis]|uniref:ARF GTPase-activating protein GIT2-like isoform X2 n=1 Tax=Ostrea edulis TaxID=37623 RepID=UPI0024AE9728|nr:ARF GTPase-activating protein GIT2-like isoform X2 [Ostrea edulis]